MLLTTGEQQSVALMAIAIHSLGYPAISLNAVQAGIHASSKYGNARIRSIETERVSTELDRNNIVVVAGFQGVNRYGDMATLGRGASDLTAVALAAALGADACEIYKDVEGIYTADPRLVKNARKLDCISYDEMIELASLGVRALQNRSVEMAKRYNLKLVVRSSENDAEGTLVNIDGAFRDIKNESGKDGSVEKTFVSGLAVDKNVARISVIGVMDQPGVAYRIFSLLAKEKISVDIILQSIGRETTKDISFTIEEGNLKQSLKILEENRDSIVFKAVSYDDKIAKLSVVGAGMAANPGVAAAMFEALYDCGVNINMISTSEIKISVLIDEADVDRAANAVHDKFISNGALIS
jgi:aspartate kinase